MGRYFGTDGVRGVANDTLTPQFALELGRAVGSELATAQEHLAPGEAGRPLVVIGRDPRRSGAMLESALAAGLCSVGVDVWRLGVVTTPAVAWIARHARASAGIVISASHNPAPDNGIKIFSGAGFKLPDAEEEAIEARLDRLGASPASTALGSGEPDDLPRPTGVELGRIEDRPDEVDAYLRFLVGLLPERLEGLRLVVDCAHGAAARLAPRVLRELGATVVAIGVEPDGDNINAGVGSTHLGPLIARVQAEGADLGLAFDGDADRCLAVDPEGKAVDGDHIMLLCLQHLRRTGQLASADIVCTVMSNLGFEEAIAREGGVAVRAKVGDRYVLEEMQRRGIRIGGEQSGHVIFLDHNTTGDGLVTALRLLAAVKAADRPLAELVAQMTVYPQILENLRVESVDSWRERPGIEAALDEAAARLEGRGRLLVRASGTEPLIRVMAEGRDPLLVRQVVDDLLAVLRQLLAIEAATR